MLPCVSLCLQESFYPPSQNPSYSHRPASPALLISVTQLQSHLDRTGGCYWVILFENLQPYNWDELSLTHCVFNYTFSTMDRSTGQWDRIYKWMQRQLCMCVSCKHKSLTPIETPYERGVLKSSSIISKQYGAAVWTKGTMSNFTVEGRLEGLHSLLKHFRWMRWELCGVALHDVL